MDMIDTATTPASRPKRRSRSLAQDVMENLASKIRNGALRPGEKLPTESEMMRAQEVSRTVVREAISRLQAAKLVETRHGIGTFVLELPKESNFRIDPSTVTTLRDVLSLMELRISLETEAAGLAAQRRSDEQLREIRKVLDDLHASQEKPGKNITSDFEFHLQIARATGNKYFVDIMTHLGQAVIPRTRIDTARLARDDHPNYLNRLNREHEDIYNAIARQDSDAARAAMRTHLSNSRERLRHAHDAAEHQQT